MSWSNSTAAHPLGKNTSNLTDPSSTPSALNPYVVFYQYAFATSFYLILVSLITVLANSCLLLVLIVDPLKTFCTPTTYFLIGLAIADLVTGLVAEPASASCFIMMYFGHPKLTRVCRPLLRVSRQVGAVSMTVSFLVIFVFTATQYVAVVSPLKAATLVTRNKVLLCVSSICIYSTLFWTSQYYGGDITILSNMDLFFHCFLIPYATIALYVLLHRAFKRKMTQRKALQSESTQRGVECEQSKKERRFIRLNFLLISVMFVCSQPSSFMWLVKFFREGLAKHPNTLIIHLMIDNLLYLKFALDPFMYAWRLPKYREALKRIFSLAIKKEESTRDHVTARFSKSTETVVTLSVRCLAE